MTGYEIISAAEDYVREVEDAYVAKLFKNRDEAHSSKCKCPNCLKQKISSEEVLANELSRLVPPQRALHTRKSY